MQRKQIEIAHKKRPHSVRCVQKFYSTKRVQKALHHRDAHKKEYPAVFAKRTPRPHARKRTTELEASAVL